jgi:hypothetical protein
MRKFLKYFLVAVFCLGVGTNVGLATLSLGSWDEGAAGSTHQVWDFTPGYIIPSGAGYTAVPEDVFNPSPNRVAATILLGTWDQVTLITGSMIFVNLEIPNYENLNPYKIIWVDIGNAVPSNIGVSAVGSSGSNGYSYEMLPGRGDAEFGVKIWPNPYTEKISFAVMGMTSQAVLDYIHVDTICIPEPVTIVLLGLGAIAALRRR